MSCFEIKLYQESFDFGRVTKKHLCLVELRCLRKYESHRVKLLKFSQNSFKSTIFFQITILKFVKFISISKIP